MKPIVVAFALLPLATAAVARQQFVREPQIVSEFPAADELIRSYQLMGRRAAAAALALQNAPARAATLDLLEALGGMDHERVDELLDRMSGAVTVV